MRASLFRVAVLAAVFVLALAISGLAAGQPVSPVAEPRKGEAGVVSLALVAGGLLAELVLPGLWRSVFAPG